MPFDIEVTADIADLVRASNVIVTTTPATAPLIRRADVQPGTHITAMGSDAPGKNEIDPAILIDADLVVCDSPAQCRNCGELASALAAGFEATSWNSGISRRGPIRGARRMITSPSAI